jgi:hypothetical protein
MINQTKLPRRRSTAIGLCLAGLLAASSVQAALIPGFGLGDFPSFDADSLVVAYDSDTDSLFVLGINDVTLDLGDESAINGLDGTGFRINVSHPANRFEAAPSGTISITGQIPDLGYTSGTLLTGDIIEFGWVESGDANSPYELQLVFAVTGGDTAGLFDGTAAIGLTQTDFPGGWDEDWVNAGEGHSVTADYTPSPVPVPGALLLFGSGLLGLARARTRKTS